MTGVRTTDDAVRDGGGSAPALPIAAIAPVERAAMSRRSRRRWSLPCSERRQLGRHAALARGLRQSQHVPILGAVAGGFDGAIAAGVAYQGQFKAQVQPPQLPGLALGVGRRGHAVIGAYTTSVAARVKRGRSFDARGLPRGDAQRWA